MGEVSRRRSNGKCTFVAEGSLWSDQHPLGRSPCTGSRKSNLKKTSSVTRKINTGKGGEITHHIFFSSSLWISEMLVATEVVGLLDV